MKLRQRVSLALAVSGALFVATAVHAQPSDKFRGLDKNGDGFLTKDEVAHLRGYDKAFDEADDNHDGRLDANEFVKAESIYDRQQVGTYVGDTTLTAKVKTALVREKGLKAANVHVETDNGRVLLSGWVDNETQRQKALKVTSKVQGVTEVKDGLTVK